MLNFEKEAMLMRVGASFLELLQERYAGRVSIGASTWFKDLAWGMRLFVEQDVPLFGGDNAGSWLAVAEQFDLRGDTYASRMDLMVPVEPWGEPDLFLAMNRVERFKRLVEKLAHMAQTENEDISGPLPSGAKGINIGEAVKLAHLFTRDFWNYSYLMPNSNPHKKWLGVVTTDMAAAQKALGEPGHAGDLGVPGSTGTGPFPWSMPDIK